MQKNWGAEEIITSCSEYCSKFLYLNPGYACSLHRHPIKCETFRVIAGSGIIYVKPTYYKVQAGDAVHVPTGTWHLFASKEGMTILEVSTAHSDADCERQSESHMMTKEGDPELWTLLFEGEYD